MNNLWSHPPGLNRRPADYETTLRSQIVEKTGIDAHPSAPVSGIAALVEQVSEQVGLPRAPLLRNGPTTSRQSHPPGLQRASSVLRQTCEDLIVSKQKLKQVERIQLVRENRDQASQTLCFSSRPFVLCGLPVRRLPKDRLLYKRRNGRFVLHVTGHPEFGVPFGQDRLVPIFLATLAVQQKSQTIRFRTAAEML